MGDLIITNGTIITDQLLTHGVVVVENGFIKHVGRCISEEELHSLVELGGFDVIDAEGGYIAPGLIDVHIHGSNGADVMDAKNESLRTISRYLVKHGTVGFLPTIVTSSQQTLFSVARHIAHYSPGTTPDEARILGVHLEGPYVNEARKCAFVPDFIRGADLSELEEISKILGGQFRLLTMAPEVLGNSEVIPWLKHRGIAVSIGHSDGTFEQTLAAFQMGVNRVTHMYNGMRGLHHREPGVVGAALVSPEIWVELIPDFVHVHAGAIEVLLRAKGVEKVVLVTDATSAAGLPDGKYNLGGKEIFARGGVVRLREGNLAGSSLTLIEGVKNMIREIGVDLIDAFRMASINPALSVGLENMGWIRKGYVADFVVTSPALDIKKTIVSGNVVYDSDN